MNKSYYLFKINRLNYFFILVIAVIISSCGQTDSEVVDDEEDYGTHMNLEGSDEGYYEEEEVNLEGSLEGSDEGSYEGEDIIDLVMALPEVIDAEENLKKSTSPNNSLTIMIEAPEGEHTAYKVEIGYDSPERFENYFTFEVDGDEIFVYDVALDDFIPIEQWRQSK